MENQFISTCIKKTDKNMLITSIFLFLIIGVVTYFFGSFFYFNLMGPVNVDKTYIESLKGDLSNAKYRYITIEGKVVAESGYSTYSRRSNDNYAIFQSGKADIVIDYEATNGDKSLYTGYLWSVDSKLMDKLEKYTKASIPKIILNTQHERWFGIVMLIVYFIVLFFAVKCLVSYIRRKSSKYIHPIYKQLEKFGNINEIENNINAEYTQDKYEYKNVIATKSWFMVKSGYDLYVNLNSEILWMYGLTEKGKAINYYIMVYLLNGNVMKYSVKVDFSKEILNIQKKIPWMLTGYSNEMLQQIGTNFGGFKSLVEQRKKELSK